MGVLHTIRKVGYNITLTTQSIVVALFIRGPRVLQIFSGQLNLAAGVWDSADNFDLSQAGFIIVGLFVATCIGALAFWKFGRIEERWSVGLRSASNVNPS